MHDGLNSSGDQPKGNYLNSQVQIAVGGPAYEKGKIRIEDDYLIYL